MKLTHRGKSFLLGVKEFRLTYTSHPEYFNAYEWGREWAHRVTLRRFEV